MRQTLRIALGLAVVLLACGAQGGCDDQAAQPSAAQAEQQAQDRQMGQFLRNQPVPSIEWSLERHMLIQLYAARQRATTTFSVVQSAYTGKVLWSCPSIGFPLPYATQLTNPLQALWKSGGGSAWSWTSAVVAQQQPNGLFTPSQSDATWVPCVDEKGRITPVYEEKKVTVFTRPVQERDGQLIALPGGAPSLSIDTQQTR